MKRVDFKIGLKGFSYPYVKGYCVDGEECYYYVANPKNKGACVLAPYPNTVKGKKVSFLEQNMAISLQKTLIAHQNEIEKIISNFEEYEHKTLTIGDKIVIFINGGAKSTLKHHYCSDCSKCSIAENNVCKHLI